MTLATKKSLKRETNDDWNAFLERRLAADLDAFLESADDETWTLFDDESPRIRRDERCKRRIFKRLSVVAASLAFCVVGATTALYVGPTSNNESEIATKNAEKNGAAGSANVAASEPGGEASLVAWGVENWGAFEKAEIASAAISKLASVEALIVWNEKEARSPDGASVASAAEDGRNDREKSDEATEAAEKWRDALALDDDSLAPLKYEPILFFVTALR